MNNNLKEVKDQIETISCKLFSEIKKESNNVYKILKSDYEWLTENNNEFKDLRFNNYISRQCNLSRLFDCCFQFGKGDNDRRKKIRSIQKNLIKNIKIYVGLYKNNHNHQNRACTSFFPDCYLIDDDLTDPSTNSVLPLEEAACFRNKPICDTRFECELFRVHKRDHSEGNWWILDKPKNKKVWRKNLAVLEQWNKGDEITHAKTKTNSEIIIWKGVAASVLVPKSACLLEGGECQIWVDSGSVGKLEIIETTDFN